MKQVRISVSELVSYRRCRRQWDYKSRDRQNIVQIGASQDNLFFGSAFHYALEDYHGPRVHGDPSIALNSYIDAHKSLGMPVPDSSDTMKELGEDMLAYYVGYWAGQHEKNYRTAIIDGQPAVELHFEYPLGVWLDSTDSPVEVVFSGKLDGVAVDEWGNYWVREYKTAGRFDTAKLDNDFQVSAYVWICRKILGNCSGVLYYQFSKKPPEYPQQLQNKRLSQDKRQNTTYALYRAALNKLYGFIPQEYIPHLNYLAGLENEHGDRFIRMDKVERNLSQVKAVERHIRAQINEIISEPEIYPNPTWNCANDCDFRTLCIAEDEGTDVDNLRGMMYRKAEDYREVARKIAAHLGRKPLEIVALSEGN